MGQKEEWLALGSLTMTAALVTTPHDPAPHNKTGQHSMCRVLNFKLQQSKSRHARGEGQLGPECDGTYAQYLDVRSWQSL